MGVRRIVLGVVLGLVLAGCGEGARTNAELSAAVRDHIAANPVGERPFADFTDWEWDRLYLFDLTEVDGDRIDEITGSSVSPGWVSGGGLFVYFKDDEVVRSEVVDHGGYCSGIYTRAAVVSSQFSCWLRDPAFARFER
ncbi:hypothetical protein [Saccharothrix obliqua]|uniref:hypothetical protein n=1 Tax=Saccharothrix obliqua TaxID=2861747 RepID=UPI001C606AEE|nr:hypothetical protein [Saccharothrix obliqua]MBW4722052.1 hypothetical protein [Saccharothrix obliqua]